MAKRLTLRVSLPGGQDRLRQMILYVSKLNENAPYFGRTKLNKILWKADFDSFRERGRPVTGRDYQRLEWGPAAKEMAPLLREMKRNNVIDERPNGFGDNVVEYRPIPLREPDLSNFDEDDLVFVKQSVRYYWHKTGREASDDSHGMAWRTRHDGDPMPYESAYLSDKKLGGAQLERIQRLVNERGYQSR